MGNKTINISSPQNQIAQIGQQQQRNLCQNRIYQQYQIAPNQIQECLQATVKQPRKFNLGNGCASKNLFSHPNNTTNKKRPLQKIHYDKYRKKSKDLQQYTAAKQKLTPLTFSTFCSIEQLQLFGRNKSKQIGKNSLTSFSSNFEEEQGLPCQIGIPIQFMTKFIPKYVSNKVEQQQFIRIKKQDINKDYEFLQKVGEGTFGEVFKCINRRTQQYRAIKRLRTNIFSNPRVKQQFLQQFNILKKTSHPNIIKMYELYQHNNFMYIVFQFCSAGTLAHLLRHIPLLSIELVKQILRQIFRAINYLHSLNIVHRDIKPQNIVLTKQIHQYSNAYDIDIRIIDFGLSVIQERSNIFRDWAKIGTVSYMAPQVFSGLYSSKCDSWSCGVIMYELIAGTNPFKLAQTLQACNHIHCFVPHSNHKADERWQALGVDSKNLQLKLLCINHVNRLKISEAIKHSSFFGSQYTFDAKEVGTKILNYNISNNLISSLQSFLSYTYISHEQQRKYSEIFNFIDSDSNGLIHIKQLINFLSLFPTLESEEAQLIFDKINKNQSGSINFGEFINVLMDKKKLFNNLYMQQAVKFIDLNHNNQIEKDQLKFFMKSLQKQEIDYIFQYQLGSESTNVDFDKMLTYIKLQTG